MKDDIKQVILVRKDLNMSVGKTASQVAHASMKVFFDVSNAVYDDNCMLCLKTPITEQEYSWFSGIFTKIVLGVESEQELIDAYEAAKDANLPCSLITDNGRTEFNGVLTNTTVAIGPAYSCDIDKITKKFKLLK